MIFDKVHLLFRIRIHHLKLRIRIRILQKVSDPDPQHWLMVSKGILSLITKTNNNGADISFKLSIFYTKYAKFKR
jgi:hypothetical protein